MIRDSVSEAFMAASAWFWELKNENNATNYTLFFVRPDVRTIWNGYLGESKLSCGSNGTNLNQFW